MICKKCGKEFNSENNICTFCNHDNNIEENVQPTETSAPADAAPAAQTPVETVTTEAQPATEEVTPAKEAPVTPVEAAPAVEEVKEEIEDLFADEKKEEAQPAELVIEEPKTEEVSPEPAKEAEPIPAETPADAAPATETPAKEVETPTEAAPTTDAPAEEKKEETSPVTTEPTTTETTDATPTEEKPKSKMNGKTILMLVAIVILAVVVVVMYLPKDEEEPVNEPATNETNNQTNTGNNNNNTPTETAADILAYSGVYKNGDIEIIMYATSSTVVSFTASTADDSSMQNLELGQEGLVVDGTSFGETVSVKVVKTAEGIRVTATSSEAESVLNKITGEYTKTETVNSTWSGVYKTGDVEFVIDQYKTNELALNYADNANYMYGQFGGIEEFTETTITYEKELFGVTTKITVTKTDTGINVVATSTDPEDDITSLNGDFAKVN